MESRLEYYEDRERLERDVERLSDEGWVLERITKVSLDSWEVEYVMRPSMVDETFAGSQRRR